MLRRTSTVMTLALAALAGASAAHAQTSTFHLVGALPGTNTYSSGYGVSEDGSVVVGHSGNNFYYGSSSHAFRWTSSNGIEDLDPLAPAAGAYGVSADGTIIVGGETSGSVKAVRWGANTSSVTDQLYHGGECYGLSRDGSTAIGWSASSGGGGTRPHRAIKYGSSGHLDFIDTPASGVVAPTTSEALATNTDGSIVVGWGVFNGTQRAFVWNATDGMQPISPGSGIANGVSGDGSVVVGDYVVGTARHAFRWTAATGLQDLGVLPGMVRSTAFAISTDGSTIVGMLSSTGFGNAQRAFVWRADVGMVDMNTVLAGVKPAGYTLTEVRSVNSNGTVFAGGSATATGGVEAWVATSVNLAAAPGVTAPTVGPVCVGSAVTVSVTASGVGPFAYQWRKDGTAIDASANPSAATASLQLGRARAAIGGSYDCVVTSTFGSTTSAAAAVGVCEADFNCTGTVEVQDIFDFLTSWFAGDPRADFNANGVMEVQDIFDDLSAWFAGCA